MTGWRKVGTARRVTVGGGSHLWVRRTSRGWSLLHEFRDPTGGRRLVELAIHRTLALALADGDSLREGP